jgi:hypothetical protein
MKIKSPPWVQLHNGWLIADACVCIAGLVASVRLARALCRARSPLRRAVAFLSIVAAHAASGVTVVETIRSEPYFLLSFNCGIIVPTVMFYVSAAISVILLLYALRHGLTFEAVSSFAFPGSFLLLFLKGAFALSYASPVGGILTDISFLATLIQTVMIKSTKTSKKKPGDKVD